MMLPNAVLLSHLLGDTLTKRTTDLMLWTESERPLPSTFSMQTTLVIAIPLSRTCNSSLLKNFAADHDISVHQYQQQRYCSIDFQPTCRSVDHSISWHSSLL
jgi:hypothetical protein